MRAALPFGTRGTSSIEHGSSSTHRARSAGPRCSRGIALASWPRARESEEARRAREAEEERARVLEAARTASTETERLVKEELARLIVLENDVRAARTRFEAAREQIALRRDIVIG